MGAGTLAGRCLSALLGLGILAMAASAALADPLPSWQAGEAKSRILAFVEATSDPASRDFVPVAERIAVFDNDGTLWAEQPVYFQLIFALDDLKARAAEDPSILSSDALRAAAAGDMKALLAGGKEAIEEVVAVTHADMTVEAFQEATALWLRTAKHPRSGWPYEQMVYQPMLELLRYLRDEGYKTYIVSGGGLHFIRSYAQKAYNIPPEQVIGSVAATEYQLVDGKPEIMKEPEIIFIDDKAGKPVAIDRAIGRRPIFAAGNSDGDFEMLEWTSSGPGLRFAMLVHHDDAAREWAYDRDSHIGRLVRGLDEGPERGWLIVSMAKDWKTIFPEAD
ncbi:MAG: HAD family hydrolase [Pseudomonadota bacterium]